MTFQDNDRLNQHERQILDLTFELAEKAFELQEVPVGCILVFNSQLDQANHVIVGRGINEVNKTKNPTRHAEFVAIEEAEQWCKDNGKSFDEVMENTTLYVTLEPCIILLSTTEDMSTSVKHRDFVGEPMGEKEVTLIAGIGEVYGKRLVEKGFDKAYILFGQFLLLRKDEDLFMDWLRCEVDVKTQHAKNCFNCLNEWAGHHI